ncbi:hypothetical protein SEA_FUZZBUSTER_61 [Microbacterium phage FuzzBuster]|uniref:Uncharacterized protein n=1 Tax=Microbacterium phage FuzzBuster TaxID=2590935 RepID=A0A516KV41_9CAUD|nr:hypothetical protein SEA_FUZZBUSTER_61 [Microbacterium phage FuzzBuster]
MMAGWVTFTGSDGMVYRFRASSVSAVIETPSGGAVVYGFGFGAEVTESATEVLDALQVALAA